MLARTSIVGVALAVVLGLSLQGVSRASPPVQPVAPASLLPLSVGISMPTDGAVRIEFTSAMDPDSVESGLRIVPETEFETRWSTDHRSVELIPTHLWATDARYLVVLPPSALTADGATVGATAPYSFTTQTAPTVADFLVDVHDPTARVAAAQPNAVLESGLAADPDAVDAKAAPPANTAGEVSRRTTITVRFSTPMDEADVEDHFAISPAVAGSFTWDGNAVTFTPETPFEPDSRYSVSVAGARDAVGNLIGGDPVFSFTTRVGAQIVRSEPKNGQLDVTGNVARVWFSAPMDKTATSRAFGVWDRTIGERIAGDLTWNGDRTQLTFVADADFTPGRQFELVVGDGAVDQEGNPVVTSSSFTSAAAPEPTRIEPSERVVDPVGEAQPAWEPAPPPPPAAAAPPPAPVATPAPVAPYVPPIPASGNAVQHALNQVNAARAAYGFAPVYLDGAVSAVAQAHASDQAANGYFSHTSLDGRSRDHRLAAGGVAYGYSGENQCYYMGMSFVDTLNWCHAAFMAEPYPGHWNHIANILDPRFTRMGVGIAQSGSTVIITWNFVG